MTTTVDPMQQLADHRDLLRTLEFLLGMIAEQLQNGLDRSVQQGDRVSTGVRPAIRTLAYLAEMIQQRLKD